jgi:hypothetical protein
MTNQNKTKHFMIGKKCWLDHSIPMQICDVSGNLYKLCDISLFDINHPSYKEENTKWVQKKRVVSW